MHKNKIFRRLIWGLTGLLVLGLLTLEIFSQLYQEKAGAYFREQFTRQSELVLQPFTTSISVWRHFPRITFSFNNISLIDTIGPKPLQVLFVKRASVALPLTQFRLDRLKISRVDLEDVLFYEQVDSSGNKAGLRFRQLNNPDSTTSNLSLVIPAITIRNAQISSKNKFKKSSYSFHVGEADLKASLQNGQLNLQGPVKGKIDHISNSRISFLRNKPFSLALHYNYLLNQKKGYLNRSYAVINQDSISISGWHIRLPNGQGSDLNLRLKGRQPLLYVFQQLLPAPTQPFLERVKTTSRMQFNYQISGVSGPRKTPRNKIAFALKNGTFYLPASKRYIKEVNLTGNMDNGAQHAPETSSFVISDLKARTEEGRMEIKLAVNNFLKPAFAIQGQGRISLPELTGLVHLPFTSVAKGTVTGSFDFTGKLPDTLRNSVPDWQGKGAVRVEKGNFRVVGLKVNCQDVQGELLFTSNLLNLKNLSGTIGRQPFKLQATINNYLAYLLQTPGKLTAQADIYAAHFDSEWLDLDDLAAPGNLKSNLPKQKKLHKAALQASSRQVLDNLQRARSQVNLQVANVNLPGQEQLKNLVVEVNQNGRRINLTRMRFTTNGGGQAQANGGFVLTGATIQDPHLNVKLHYPFINLQQFMLDLAALKGEAPEPDKPVARTEPNSFSKYFKENDYRLNLQLTAARLEYLFLKGSDLNLEANLNRHRAKLDKLRVNAFGGQLNARGEMQLDAPGDSLPVKLRTQVNNINLQRLFALAENMELDVLGSQNIKGTAHCNLNVTTTLDKTFSPSFAGTVAYAQARFQNMELIEVAPIQHALRFLRSKRTEHLYFEDVKTSFIMSSNQFITPSLPLNSNLTAFEMNGTYTMGGGASLNMDVNVFTVLFGNNKRRIQKIQSDTLALNTQGRKQHLVITREKEKYKVKLSNQREREENRLALRQEFNRYLRRHQIDTVFTMNR